MNKSKPCYFCFGMEDDINFVSIVYKDFYDKHGHLDDRGTASRLMESLGFYDLMESVYEWDDKVGTLDDARKLLISLGWEEKDIC
jgi:hypothetical protein